MAQTASPYPYLTVEEYLAMEEVANVRHEYVGGQLYALAGTSVNHNRILRNLIRRLSNAADGSSCEVLFTDVKLRVLENVFYYPDLIVVCDPADDHPMYRTRPCVVVEILSPSTEPIDRREKLFEYRQLASLKAYVMVFQDQVRVQRHYRDDHGHWANAEVADRGVVPFPCPEIELSLADIYEGIDLDANGL